MNRITLLILLILGILFQTNAQNVYETVPDSLARYIDNAVAIASKQSIYKEQVNWESLKQNMYKEAKNANSFKDLIPSFEVLFAELGDFHGALWSGTKRINSFRKPKSEKDSRIEPKIWNQIQRGEFKVRSQMLESKTAYISLPLIPAFSEQEIAQYTKLIREHICRLNSQQPDNWIVDLRLCGGGNMIPLLSGMGKLIGEGKFGGVFNSEGKTTADWQISDGMFLWSDFPMAVGVDNCMEDLANPNIIVLIGPYTASSGEALAIALKGKDKVRFLGSKTAGYTSSNSWHEIKPNYTLSIAEGYYHDRNNKTHKGGVEPDDFVRSSAYSESLDDDNLILEALMRFQEN